MTNPVDSLGRLRLITASDNGVDYRLHIDAMFTVGSKVHGGSLQAVCANAAIAAFAVDGPLSTGVELIAVAVTTDHLAAPNAGDVDVRVTAAKRGKRMSAAHVRISQSGRDMVCASVTLGPKETGDEIFAAAPTALAEMSVEPDANAQSITDTVMAPFMNVAGGVEIIYDSTTIPFDRAQQGAPTMRMWARPRQEQTDAIFAVLCGDLSTPVVMNLGLLGWAPTVTLTTYLRRQPAPGWLRIQSSTISVGQTYFTEEHLIIDSAGAIVAQSTQVALVSSGVAP